MRILLLGPNGQVGWELQRSLAPLGELIALDRRGLAATVHPAAPESDTPPERPLVGDLSNLQALARAVQHLRPQVIVNAAAYTAVDKAQSEPELCHTINTEAPAVLARCAAASGALLVHYSTDYVFDGSGNAPWHEGDGPAPLNVYGRTKLEGERAIAASGCRHLIFRTSWVYAARGGNFAKTMLRLAQERERLTVINDQHGAPTGADLIADITAHAVAAVPARPELTGTYHLVASGETTWHGYASHVIARAREQRPDLPWTVNEVAPVPTTAFRTPAQRPLNSRLATRKLQEAFGLTLPAWQHGVNRMLAETLS